MTICGWSNINDSYNENIDDDTSECNEHYDDIENYYNGDENDDYDNDVITDDDDDDDDEIEESGE